MGPDVGREEKNGMRPTPRGAAWAARLTSGSAVPGGGERSADHVSCSARLGLVKGIENIPFWPRRAVRL